MFAASIERHAITGFGSNRDTGGSRRLEALEPLLEQFETAKAELLRIHRNVADCQEEALGQAAQRKDPLRHQPHFAGHDAHGGR
ncbi:hypothetical protein D3C87_2059800 [compost metagenome]